jgi:hypothetical protein
MAVLSSPIADLLADRLMPLGPGAPNRAVYERLQALTPASLCGDQSIQDMDAAHACLAAIWLWHDFLDEAHTLSQNIDTPEGSWWHAIMHRREPDASNSKYWFRRVGNHPVLKMLAEQAPGMGFTFTTPQRFVDFCEKARDTGTADEETAKRVQKLEWTLLFHHCHEQAIS